MSLEIIRVPFAEHLLERLARDLRDQVPTAAEGDLSGALVLLPSTRAGRTLGHALLDQTDRAAWLLPRVLTPAQLLAELAVAHGLDTAALPDDTLRAVALAHRLRDLPWLSGRPENAPGLAEEYITLFDELRRHGQERLLNDPRAWDEICALTHPAAEPSLRSDLARINEVWRLYRQIVPRDSVDVQVDVSARPAPALPFTHLVIAGFGRLDPVQGQLIRSLMDLDRPTRMYLPEATGGLATFFTATWGPDGADLNPLAGSRQVARVLLPDEPPEPEPAPAGPLRDRLAALGDLSGLWAPAGPLHLMPCGNPEDESRRVADRVVGLLGDPGAAGKRAAIVTNDPVLAARITAQLWDAGIDVDNTLGQPLSTQPAGLLLRAILRAAVTNLRPEDLLDVLTQPLVRLPFDGGRHGLWTLRLEKMLRRGDSAPDGPETLRLHARRRDEAAARVSGRDGPGLSEFVQAVITAFAPLLDLPQGRPVGWVDQVTALRRVWDALAPDTPLAEDKQRADLTAADRLLKRLEHGATLLADGSLSGFAADVSRLLSAENVAPHRALDLPVLVTGTVEARLEHFDTLLLAGLSEGVFPKRRGRPLFLDGAVRRGLGLPGWRDALARDAELFLRLLHNGDQVVVSWSTEEGGRPRLPSPFVERLKLGTGLTDPLRPAPPVPLWRRKLSEADDIAARQTAFATETLNPDVHELIRPLNRLSWSALRTWRECPYRFLLERGFVLRKEDEVREEFGRRDVGQLIHRSLFHFLEPGSEGYEALAAGQRTAAVELLTAQARRDFLPEGQELPGRVIWLDSFLNLVPALVSYEMERFTQWRPVLLEGRFELALPDLIAWARREAADTEVERSLAGLEDSAKSVVLTGAIDRIDRYLAIPESEGFMACVLDYKTGAVPSVKKVAELEDMQVLLYALAVETGAVDLPAGLWRVTEGFYYPIAEDKVGRVGKPHLDARDDAGRQLLVSAALRLIRLSVLAARTGADFPLLVAERQGDGDVNLPCRYCDFRGVCRVEEKTGLPEPTTVKLDRIVNRKEGGF